MIVMFIVMFIFIFIPMIIMIILLTKGAPKPKQSLSELAILLGTSSSVGVVTVISFIKGSVIEIVEFFVVEISITIFIKIRKNIVDSAVVNELIINNETWSIIMIIIVIIIVVLIMIIVVCFLFEETVWVFDKFVHSTMHPVFAVQETFVVWNYCLVGTRVKKFVLFRLFLWVRLQLHKFQLVEELIQLHLFTLLRGTNTKTRTNHRRRQNKNTNQRNNQPTSHGRAGANTTTLHFVKKKMNNHPQQ
mmetsp:Transcript_32960/g.45249  ORF Transcript_32960/g.45249 Transcript_32960/m.45249 type:complete len:247 (+) Transcript_32960:1317-2057(+)